MPGWKQRSRTVSSVVGLLLVNAPVAATDVPPPADATAGPAMPAAFFEFLAEWEDAQGGWQDPMEFSDDNWQSMTEGEAQRYENN